MATQNRPAPSLGAQNQSLFNQFRTGNVPGRPTGSRTPGTAETVQRSFQQPSSVDPSGLGASRPGVASSVNPDLARQALAGVTTTQTHIPQFDSRGRLRGLQSTESLENPIAPQDVAAQAFLDVEAQAAAKEETRAIAEEALAGVHQGFGTAIDEATQALGESSERIRGIQDEDRQRGQGRFDEAAEATRQSTERGRSREQETTERAEQFREDALGEFQSEFALRVDTMRRGLERDFNRRRDSIDDQIARGNITAAGGRSASEVGSALKAQVESEYRDQLRAQAGQIAVQASQISAQVRQAVDAQTLSAIQAAGATGAGVELGGAQNLQQIAAAEATADAASQGEARMAELGLLQANLAIQQLRIKEPEMAAELMLSTAYLPQSTSLYPLMVDLYDMYEIRSQDPEVGVLPPFQGSVGAQQLGLRRSSPQELRPGPAGGGAGGALGAEMGRQRNRAAGQ